MPLISITLSDTFIRNNLSFTCVREQARFSFVYLAQGLLKFDLHFVFTLGEQELDVLLEVLLLNCGMVNRCVLLRYFKKSFLPKYLGLAISNQYILSSENY